jgi:hypothetical protein
VATSDYSGNSTGTGSNFGPSFAEAISSGGSCPATALAVRTYVRTHSVSSGDLVSTAPTAADQPFTFLVP